MARRQPSMPLARSLFDLPAEVLQLVAQGLKKASDLNAFCLTHPYLYRLLNQSLYRHSVQHDGSFVLIYAALTGNLSAATRALALVAPIGGPAANIETIVSVHDRRYRAASLSYHPEDAVTPCCARRGNSPLLTATVNGGRGMGWRYYTPLGCAVAHEHVDMVKLLLSHGARVADASYEQVPPVPRAPPVLHIAALLGDRDVVSALLLRLRTIWDQKDDNDSAGIRKVLSLHYSGREIDGVNACPVYLGLREGHEDVVEILLWAMREQLGARETAEVVRKLMPAADRPWFGKHGNEILEGLLAAKTDVFERLVCLLDEFGGDSSLAHALATAAARVGDLEKLRFMVARGLALNGPSDGRTIYRDDTIKVSEEQQAQQLLPVLHAAVTNGHVNTARYLLKLGADPTARAPPSLKDLEQGTTGDGLMALHVALAGPDERLVDMVSLLFTHHLHHRRLQHEVDLPSKTVQNESGPPTAIITHESSSLDTNSFINARTLCPRGLTALMFLASQARHEKYKIYSPSRSKRTPSHKRHTLTSPGCAAVLRILLSHGADITLRSLPTSTAPPRSVLYLTAVRQCYFCTRAMLSALGYEQIIAIMQEEWHPPLVWGQRYLPSECVKGVDGMMMAVPLPAVAENVTGWRHALGLAFWDEFGLRVEEVEIRRRIVEEFRASWEESGDNKVEKGEKKWFGKERTGRARRKIRRRERVAARMEGEKTIT